MKTIAATALAVTLVLGGAGLAWAQAGPTAQTDTGSNPAVKSPSQIASGPLATGHNSFTKGEARQRIKDAGYTQVRGLMKDSNGLWQAQAMHAGAPVNVALDYKGDVATH